MARPGTKTHSCEVAIQRAGLRADAWATMLLAREIHGDKSITYNLLLNVRCNVRRRLGVSYDCRTHRDIPSRDTREPLMMVRQ